MSTSTDAVPPRAPIPPGRTFSRALRSHLFLVMVAALAVGASEIPYRFSEETLVGLFFTLVALLGMIFAAAIIVRPSHALFRLAFWVAAGLIGLWVIALTIGLPFGPFAGRVEPFSIADGLTLALALIALPLIALLVWGQRPAKVGGFRWVMLGGLPTLLLVSVVTF